MTKQEQKRKLKIFFAEVDIIFKFAIKDELPKEEVVTKVTQRLEEYKKQMEEKNE